MCEINPKHSAYFRLEAFTSHNITREEFDRQVAERLMAAEQALNADGAFRFHIHEGMVEGAGSADLPFQPE
ncbi:MAG: hypothetical protein AB7V18_19385 [Pyrinomonadaceae bacterium]